MAVPMTENPPSDSHDRPDLNVEQGMAVIEKGQQLAGHFPNAETMSRVLKVLTGELSPEEARAGMNEALARIADEECEAQNGR